MAPVDFLKDVRERLGDTPFTIVTPTPEALAAARSQRNSVPEAEEAIAVEVEVVPNILAPLVGLLAARRARAGITSNSLTLDAHYVRRTDAELKWKEI